MSSAQVDTKRLMLLLLTTLAAAVAAHQTSNGWYHEVTTLPGWEGAFPSRLYSGYVKLTGDDVLPPQLTHATEMFMHYFLFEAEGADPSSKPTIVWWNGGPGASSAWGLFVENGPFMLNEQSVVEQLPDGTPRLIGNPYSWTKFANLVAFCNPPPVGFSYCEPAGPTGNGTACGTWNDTRVGITDAEAIRVVLTVHFPHLTASGVYFMGESYAGVYIGETLQWMLAKPEGYTAVLNQLRGVALGDACLGGDVLCGGSQGPFATLMFFYGHGQVSTELWSWLLTQCNQTELHSRSQSTVCSNAINKIYTAIGGYYAYNLVDQCTSDAFQAQKEKLALHRKQRLAALSQSNASSNSNADIVVPLENGYWCPGLIFFDYFDRDDVRAATFVPLNSTFFNADDGEGMSYVYNSLTVMPTIASLVENRASFVNGGRPVQVWAYDGDTDPSVNVFSTQEAWWKFAGAQNYTKTSEWHAWTISGSIVGGYITEWEGGVLKYVTIRGSGHMVAEYKPASALAMVQGFLDGKSLPAYVQPPQSKRNR